MSAHLYPEDDMDTITWNGIPMPREGLDCTLYRWHVVHRGVRCDDDVFSFPTIQDALDFIGPDSPTPYMPCDKFAECPHCAKALAS
jgi:hypothetical protein